jgi:hypothetical protein
MKKSILILSVLLSTNLYSRTVIKCVEHDNSSYPLNPPAIKLAKHLKVSTCDGKQFVAASKMLGAEILKVQASDKQKEKIEASKKAKLKKRLGKKMRGFSL